MSERKTLQGWEVELSYPEQTALVLEKARDYRGDVTLILSSGQEIEGYIFDCRSGEAKPEDCIIRLFPKNSDDRISVPCAEIRRIRFSGRDAAEGKSFELWLKRYREKKARGDQNVSLEPEPLD